MNQPPQNQNQGNSPQARGNQKSRGNPNAGNVRDADKEKRIRTDDKNPGDARTVEEHGGAPGDEERSDMGDHGKGQASSDSSSEKS